MGVRTRGILCLTNHIGSLPLEGCGNERPADSQVCNNGPCENRIEWYTGPWNQVCGRQKVTAGLKGKLSGAAGFYNDFILTCHRVFFFPSLYFSLSNSIHMVYAIFVCETVLCRVRRRQSAEVGGVSDENRWRIHSHAAVWVLLPGSAS